MCNTWRKWVWRHRNVKALFRQWILVCKCLYLLKCACSLVANRFVSPTKAVIWHKYPPTLQCTSYLVARNDAIQWTSSPSKPSLTEYRTRSTRSFYGSRQLRTRAYHDDYKSGPPRKYFSLALAGRAAHGMLQKEPGKLRHCQGELDEIWEL